MNNKLYDELYMAWYTGKMTYTQARKAWEENRGWEPVQEDAA